MVALSDCGWAVGTESLRKRPRNHIRCAFQKSLLLETELCGSLGVGPGCFWASSLSLGLLSTLTCLGQRLWGVTLGTGPRSSQGKESRGLAFRMGARFGGTQMSLGFDSVPVSLFVPPLLSSSQHLLPSPSLGSCTLVHLVPPRAHGGDLRLGGGTARRQAGEGWKAGPGQREGPRAGSRGNRSPGRPQGPGWDRREVGAQFHRALLQEGGRRSGHSLEEDAGTRVLASRGGPRGWCQGLGRDKCGGGAGDCWHLGPGVERRTSSRAAAGPQCRPRRRLALMRSSAAPRARPRPPALALPLGPESLTHFSFSEEDTLRHPPGRCVRWVAFSQWPFFVT